MEANKLVTTLLFIDAIKACDRIAAEHPEHAMMIAEMKSDLQKYPSTGHIKSVVSTLLEVAQDTYTEDF